MEKINAIITGIGGYVPDYILTNQELSRMVDTTDEWIQTRVGIKERRILTEEGLGTSYMARKAASQLLEKTGPIPTPSTRLSSPRLLPTTSFPRQPPSSSGDWGCTTPSPWTRRRPAADSSTRSTWPAR